MNQQILIREQMNVLRNNSGSTVAKILRAVEEWKDFLIISIKTGDPKSGNPEADRIVQIDTSLADSTFGILEGGLFVIDPPTKASDWFAISTVYERIAALYPQEKTVVCMYSATEIQRLALEIDRYPSLSNRNSEWFKNALCVEHLAASFLGLKPGEDRSLQSIMERLEIKPFEGSYDQENNDIHTLLVLQKLFRDTSS